MGMYELVFKLTIQYRKLTWRSRMQPDFLIVGAMKCGTTSLHYYLAQHPQLMPAFMKEVRFFDGGLRGELNDNFKKGEAWYRAHFPRPTNANQHAFESTPGYIFYPSTVERIFTCNSKMKIIMLLRNPTERAISHYFYISERHYEQPPIIKDVLVAEKSISEYQHCHRNDSPFPFPMMETLLRRGLYAQQIKRFLSYFPQEQILILNSEDLLSQTRQTVRQVFEFVGVDEEFEVKDIAPHNTTSNKVAVDPEVRQYLDHYFLPHNEELYQLIGRNFGW